MSGRAGMPLVTDSRPPHEAGTDDQTTLDHKCRKILARELQFAHNVALRLVDKPELSVWMILIPIIFLHFMFRAQRFKAGLGTITRDLLASREFALWLARQSVEDGVEAPDPATRFPGGNDTRMSAQLREAEIHLSRVLIGHYRRLLQAHGTDYEALVRDAYGTEQRYRAEFLTPLAEAEQRVGACACAAADVPEAGQTFARMDTARRELREEDVAACFNAE